MYCKKAIIYHYLHEVGHLLDFSRINSGRLLGGMETKADKIANKLYRLYIKDKINV